MPPYTTYQARAEMRKILQSIASPTTKYRELHQLDVMIQNLTPEGLASPVISEILDAQYRLILKIESESQKEF